MSWVHSSHTNVESLTQVLSDHMMVTSEFTVITYEAASNLASRKGLVVPLVVIVGLEVLAFIWRKLVRN